MKKLKNYINTYSFIFYKDENEYEKIKELIKKELPEITLPLSYKLKGYIKLTNDSMCIFDYQELPKKHIVIPAKDFFEIPFEVGKWYKFNWIYRSNVKSNQTIIKVKEVDNISQIVISSFRIYLHDNNVNYKTEDGYSFNDILNVEEITDLNSIQEYLPDNHPDKIKRKFELNDKVILPIDDRGYIANFYTQSDGIPKEKIKHGLKTHIDKSLPNGTVVDFYNEYYIVQYIDKNNNYVQLGFKEKDLKSYEEYLMSKEDLVGRYVISIKQFNEDNPVGKYDIIEKENDNRYWLRDFKSASKNPDSDYYFYKLFKVMPKGFILPSEENDPNLKLISEKNDVIDVGKFESEYKVVSSHPLDKSESFVNLQENNHKLIPIKTRNSPTIEIKKRVKLTILKPKII